MSPPAHLCRSTIRNEVTVFWPPRHPFGRRGLLANIFGVSGMGILEALAEGKNVIKDLPKLLARNVKKKQDSSGRPWKLAGGRAPNVAGPASDQIGVRRGGYPEGRNPHFGKLAPYKDKLDLLMTIPGISYLSACVLLAELGVDMTSGPLIVTSQPGWRGSWVPESAARRIGRPPQRQSIRLHDHGRMCWRGSPEEGLLPRRQVPPPVCTTGSKMKAKVAIAGPPGDRLPRPFRPQAL